MPDNKHGPLNPDSEQQLFEKLSMSEAGQEYLEYIRNHMRKLVKSEQNERTETNKT